MTEPSVPELSAIVAARNASSTLAACLEALVAQAGNDVEVLVIDDGSTDDTRQVASRYPVRVVALGKHLGVSAARNRGAALARAPLLFFVDADVVLAPGVLQHARERLAESGADAVIGSYDDDPAAASTVSRFKNLAHHHFHQRSNPEAATFWGACGLIRKASFLSAGGFDAERFRLPSIEDVALGYRLVEQGGRIRLDRDLRVKHLKHWTIGSMVATDVLRRAIPWTVLMLERGRLPNDLNFDWRQRVASLIAVALTGLLPAALMLPRVRWLLLAALAAALWINRDLFRLFLRRGGIRFATAGFFLQQFYYLYSLVGFAAGVMVFCARRLAGKRPTTTLKENA